MSEQIELPTYVGFLWPAVLAVRELGGAADIRRIDASAVEYAGLTETQRSRRHATSWQTEAEYRLAWARTALKGMGILENIDRGTWRLTPLGKTMPESELPWRLEMYLAELRDSRRERTGRQPRTRIGIVRVEIPKDGGATAQGSLEDLSSGVQLFAGPLPDPVETLEAIFAAGGLSLIVAVFQNTFFLHPSVVRKRTPYFPNFARYSRTYYGAAKKGDSATWQGITVRIDDNSRAQSAWEKYSGRGLSRGVGYAIRHIWGNAWDPCAYTAGWNLAYMPNWAGMLTEEQHPHPLVQQAIRQASWDLFFARDPVYEPRPDFVSDPGVNLTELLDDQPLLVLAPGATAQIRASDGASPPTPQAQHALVRALRARTSQSWSNLLKAVASLQGRAHEPFGTPKVEASSKSVVRRMCREASVNIDELERIIREISAS